MYNRIKRVFVVGLYELGNDYLLEFEEGSNCLFGDNGTGKTTIINLIVAGLSADFMFLTKSKFNHVVITVANSEGKETDISIYKSNKEAEEKYGEEFGVIVYDVEGDDFTFEYPLDSMDRRRRKLLSGRKLEPLTRKLRELINLTHVPLLRIRREEALHDIYKEEYHFLDERRIEPEELDTSITVLVELEKRFKELAEGYRSEDTSKLEAFKSQIIQKFLIDKNDLNIMNKPGMQLKSLTDEGFVVDELVDKLDSAGLSVPQHKLVESFELIAQLGQEAQNAYEVSRSLDNSEASEEEIAKVDHDVNKSVLDLLVTRTLFQRFESVLSDVEDLQKDRNSLWELFRSFESIINQFLNNKFFKVDKNGEFKIISGTRRIDFRDLSSGEKHIIAILGRAALSQKKGSVFIADEPELSLHLSWQRKVLPSILELSPKSQIIVATHSPAIIPKEANKINLGECQ